MQVNGPGRVEINQEEIPGSKRSMHGQLYIDLSQALKGEPSSSVFSTDETLISACAASHYGLEEEKKEKNNSNSNNDISNNNKP